MLTAAIDRTKIGIAVGALLLGSLVGAIGLSQAQAVETEGVLLGCVDQYTGVVRIDSSCADSQIPVIIEGEFVQDEPAPRGEEPTATEAPDATATPEPRSR